MVRREICPQCKGNRFITVTRSPQKDAWIKCPSCGGQGYRVRLSS